MKIEGLNSWLGLAGNVAVVLGLVALAIEINGNTAAVRAQELASTDAIGRERQMLLATNPGVRSLYVKSLYNASELTTEDLLGITAYLMARVETLRQTRRSYLAGTISKEDWEDDLRSAPIYLGGSFARVWWSVAKEDFAHDLDFVAAIDAELADPSVVPDDEWYIDLDKALTESGL